MVKFSIGFGFLVVATTSQGLIYNTMTWAPPIQFEVRDSVTLIRQSERCFLTVDSFNGIQIMSYDGRRLSNPKFQGLQTELLRRQAVALSSDTLAVIDRKEHHRGEPLVLFRRGHSCPCEDGRVRPRGLRLPTDFPSPCPALQ